MPRTIIIGDVHGCLRELRSLIDLVQPTDDDEVIFVGDLVDKGDDSPGVIRFVRGLSQSLRVVVVEGNHESKHRQHRRNVSRGVVREGEVNEITSMLTPEDVHFMDEFVPFHKVEQHNILVVHGGMPSNWTEFPTIEQFKGLSKTKQRKFLKVSRTRFVCKNTGKFRPLGNESPDDPFWTEIWDGRFGHIVFGHEPFLTGPDVREHSTGIDTGCVHGGHLTSLVVENDGSRHFISVPGRLLKEPRDC
jgi:serine/threonine protein phosphatase 1